MALIINQCKLNPNYEKNITTFIEELDTRTETDVIRTLNTLTQMGGFSLSDYEYLVAVNPQISGEVELQSQEIFKLKEFLSEKYFNEIEKAKIHYTDSLKSFLVNNYYFEYLRSEMIIADTIPKVLFDLVYQTSHNDLNQIELYSYLRLLMKFAVNLKSSGYTELHLAAIDYALHIIETNKFKLDFLKFKCELNEIKLREFIEMTLENSILKDLYETNLQASKRLNSLDVQFGLRQLNTMIDSGFISNQSVDSIKALHISLKNKRFLALDNGFYLMESNPSESIPFFDYVISTFDDECHWMKNYTYDVLGIVYDKLNKIDTSREYFRLSGIVENCDKKSSVNILFSNIQLQLNYVESLYSKMKPWDVFETYEKQRKISLDLFKNESDHYNDYYVQNVANTLNAFINNPIESKPKILKILNLVSSSKSREIKRKKLIDEENDKALENKRIVELKRRFNNFKDIQSFEDSEREELFKLLLYDKMNNEDFHIVDVPDQFTEVKIEKIISNPHEAFLDFLEYEDRLFTCLYYRGKLKVNKLENNKIDSLIRLLNFQIFKKLDIAVTLNDLQKNFCQNLPSGIQKIRIRSDGVLNNLPMHLVFDVPIQILDNNSDFVNYNSKTLSSEKSVVFSFSNDFTLKSNSKRQIPELKYGYSECISVHKSLNSEDSIISGTEMSKSNFINILPKDILHISSHAFASEDNRYDNYIIFRNTSSTLDTLYSYELAEMNHFPTLAVISACESGLGEHINGKGTYDVGRSFLDNGSQAVIKSLWKVNDKSTQVFMSHLYSNWKSGISLSQALVSTRDYMQTTEFGHAFYWAGFILEGNGELYLK